MQLVVFDHPWIKLDALTLPYYRTLCDLREVVQGTGAELYNIVLKEFASVGCKTWDDRAREFASKNFPGMSVFVCTLDKGPDNQGLCKLMTNSLTTCPNVMCWFIYCFLHQYHLIVKTVLQILDDFEWDEPDYQSKYFSGIATVANTWRSPGHHMAPNVWG